MYMYNHTAYISTYIGLYIQVRVHNHSTFIIYYSRKSDGKRQNCAKFLPREIAIFMGDYLVLGQG